MKNFKLFFFFFFFFFLFNFKDYIYKNYDKYFFFQLFLITKYLKIFNDS